jgi:hypothetical protein
MGNKRGINAKGLLLRSCYVFGALFFVRLQKKRFARFQTLYCRSCKRKRARLFKKGARAFFIAPILLR